MILEQVTIVMAGNLGSSNCYVLGDEEKLEAVVIDPGGQVDEIFSILSKNRLTLKWIIGTHGHIDHVAGCEELKQKAGGEILLHNEGLADYEGTRKMFSAQDDQTKERQYITEEGIRTFNFQGLIPETITFGDLNPDKMVADGDIIQFGNYELEVFETPGHSKGSISLYQSDAGVVFVGDLLFPGSVGQTFHPGSSFKTLVRSVRDKIFALPDETKIMCGHGPMVTTVGNEKSFNPFVNMEK